MPNPFAKGWNYFKASVDKSVDDNADPKVLVHQAMTGAKEQHKAIADQAAAVIGNAKQLEIQMATRSRAVEEDQGRVRQTLQLAESARSGGDEAKAAELDTQAAKIAERLVTSEQDLEQTRTLHGQAVEAAEQAKQAVAQSETRLREVLAQEDRLLLQATQAKMQQQQVDAMTGVSGNSPTFEEIQAKIEGRFATAVGQQELAEATGRSRTAALEATETLRQSEGRAKLDQIRASMGLGSPTTDTGALTEGPATEAASPELAPPTATDEPDTTAPGLPRDTRGV